MLHKLLPVFAALSVALYAPLTVATASDFVAPYLKGGYQLASPGDGYGQPLNVSGHVLARTRYLRQILSC